MFRVLVIVLVTCAGAALADQWLDSVEVRAPHFDASIPPYSYSLFYSEVGFLYFNLGKYNFEEPGATRERNYVALFYALDAAGEEVEKGMSYDSALEVEQNALDQAHANNGYARDYLTNVFKTALEKIDPIRKILVNECNAYNQGKPPCDQLIEQHVQSDPDYYEAAAKLVIEQAKLTRLFEIHLPEFLRAAATSTEAEYLDNNQSHLKQFVLQLAAAIHAMKNA